MSSNFFESPYVIKLSPTSHDLYDIQQKINGSMIDSKSNFEQKWTLQKALNIDNKEFSKDFMKKRMIFHARRIHYSQSEIRYGFLATIKESMVHKVANEGLEVRLCPYNFLGYNISGIHISQNADICLNEASKKIGPNDEIILIVFKYMLGNSKTVPMYDPNILLAPTPNYESHTCEEVPNIVDTIRNQYIKSMVYLYEFENANYDPVTRPKHCCPVAALVFKLKNPSDPIDLTVPESIILADTVRDESPVPFYNPNPKTQWARDFLLQPPEGSENNTLIEINTGDDFRNTLISESNGVPKNLPSPIEETPVVKWEPIGQNFSTLNYPAYKPVMPDIRDQSTRARGRARYDMKVGAMNSERDRSYDLLSQWKSRNNGESCGNVEYYDKNYQSDIMGDHGEVGYPQSGDYADDMRYPIKGEFRDSIKYPDNAGHCYAENVDYRDSVQYPKNVGYFQSANYDDNVEGPEDIGYFNSAGYTDVGEYSANVPHSDSAQSAGNVNNFGFSKKIMDAKLSQKLGKSAFRSNFGFSKGIDPSVSTDTNLQGFGPVGRKVSSRNWFR